MSLERLMNLGPKSTAWLADAGIRTAEELERLGAVEAYRRVRAVHPRRVSVVMLYALEAALRGARWTDLSPEERRGLRDEAARSETDPGEPR